MGGSKLQLYSKGIENSYLTKNPEMTYFKKIYKRYSNFAMQSIDLHFEKMDSLHFDNPTTIKLKFGKNGDLIHKVFLELTIPAICNTPELKISWADNIGEIIIKEARIYIGGELIEKFDTEFLHIHNTLSETQEENKMRKNMANVINKTGVYRAEGSSIGNSNKNKFFNIEGKTYLNYNYNTVPSFIENRIIIPLPFWFHRDIGCALPIQNLIYHDVMLEIDIRPIKELINYSVVHEISSSINHNQIKSVKNLNKDLINSLFKNNQWNLDPILNTTFIFLDKEEKRNYFNNTLQYLVEPIYKYEANNIENNILLREDLSSVIPRQMCKDIYITSKRTDIKNRNLWLNFSNMDDIHNKYYDYQNYFYYLASEGKTGSTNKILNLTEFNTNNKKELNKDDWVGLDENLYVNPDDSITNSDIQNFLDIWNYRHFNNIPSITRINQDFFNKEIIKKIGISFDETVRVTKRDSNYYNKIQPYQHQKNYLDGVYMYSFSLHPNKYEPSGKCNLEHINNISIDLDLKKPSDYDTENYLYDIFVYFRYYNILEIKSGMGDLLFRN